MLGHDLLPISRYEGRKEWPKTNILPEYEGKGDRTRTDRRSGLFWHILTAAGEKKTDFGGEHITEYR